MDVSDFCNAFWSVDDSGVEAVLTRLKAGSKALDDLRAFYKDRAAIEEDYSKRLHRLSRQHLGKDETGLMKESLERVRVETANLAESHEKLAGMIRVSLEHKTKEFDAARDARKRNPQASVEKLLKTKQQQEALVNKSREKYKADCIAINGYTAQTSLVQGRDLDKVSAKLDKAQSTIQVNEKEYKAYLGALKETTSAWALEWKAFTDLVQDLEEERLNYMRISLWEYANGHSFICVTDDEFCENIRKSLETCDAQADLLEFVRRNATGNKIPDPPYFVDYSKGDTGAPKVTFKTANFTRSSARQEIIHTGQSLQDLAAAIKPSGQAPKSLPASRDSRPSNRPRANSSYSRSSSRPTSSYTEPVQAPIQSSQQDSTPRKQPDRAYSASVAPEPAPSTPTATVSQYSASQEAIRNYAASQPGTPQSEPKPASDAFSVKSTTKPLDSPKKAEAPASPAPSTFGKAENKDDPIARALAALRDPARASEAAEKYSPIERQKSKSSLRTTARSGSYAAPTSRPSSTTPSSTDIPSSASINNGATPWTPSVQNVASPYTQAAPQQIPHQSTRPISPRPGSAFGQPSPAQQQRFSPAPHQQRYSPAPQQQQRYSPAPQQQQQAPAPVMSDRPFSPASQSSYYAPVLAQHQRPLTHQHANSQNSLAGRPVDHQRATTPRQSMDYQRLGQSPVYGQAPPPQTMNAGPQQLTPAQLYAQQARSPSGSAQGYVPQQQQAPQPHAMARPVSAANLQQPYQAQPARSPSPVMGHQQMAPSHSLPQVGPPAPAAQNPTPGRPVLFFVRAMYDYQAQVPEEFSFQADDVIAVFATDPDGWWQGELLDETRKRLGGNTFPSNFCTLLE